MNTLSHASLSVDDPQITELLDVRSGEYRSHLEVIGSDYERAIQLRMELRPGIKRGSPSFRCSICSAPVYLVSRATERRFFFRHTREDEGCPARTRGTLSQVEINARKYNGAKESDRHWQLKTWIAECLTADPHFEAVQVEQRWPGQLTGEWRRPDVRAAYNGIPLAFEIQLSTTYINVIAERREFYLREGGLLFWIFGSFEEQARRLTQDDVFYNNNQNAFLINETAHKRSLTEARFALECVWAEPAESALHREVVYFDTLTLDQKHQRAYFFDFDRNRQRYNAQRTKERAVLGARFEDWWVSSASTRTPNYRPYTDLRAEFQAQGVQLPFRPQDLPHGLLNARYSAKNGRVVGWEFKTFIEVAHRVEGGYKRDLHTFRRALKAFGRAEQLRAEDRSGKWLSKTRAYKAKIAAGDSAYDPDLTHAQLVATLFPELQGIDA